MPINYINSAEKNLGHGIDVRSSENQIADGFVKDLLNADVVEMRVRKRRGYQGHAGNVPVRVIRLDYESTTGEACFTLDNAVSLDTSVSLESVRSSPLVVYGRSSNQTVGPFTSSGDTVKYYDKFTVPTRKQITAPSGTLAIPADEHGFGTTNLFVNVVESTSLTDRSYTKVITDSITINETSFDLSIGYSTYVNRDVFVYYADKTPVAGNSYVATLNHTGSGSETFSIPTATHNLTNYNITVQIQQDLGATRTQVIPDSFLLANNGDVSVTLNSSSATTYYVILSAAPVTNSVSGVVQASSSGTVLITAPTKPWVFLGIYLEQTPGGTKELVYPDSVDYDSNTNQLTLSFTNQAITARNFIVFYEYGDVRSNRLCVADASVVIDGTDMAPQLTLWGLDHSEIYPVKSNREGWVNLIDAYRRSGEQRVVAGLGGNLFEAAEYSEAASTYLLPTLYPRLFARSASNQVLGPAFYDTGDTPARTRGYITSDNSGTGWATVTEVQYDSGNGYTKYTISLPNKTILNSLGAPSTLSSVVSVATSLEDWLTVQNMSYKRHNGTFRIRQLLDSTDKIYVWVENSTNSADYDDLNTGGAGGIFTDQIQWTANAPFIPEDSLLSSSLGDTFQAEVLSCKDTTTVSNDFTEITQIPGGLLMTGNRVSSVVPLREALPSLAESTTNLVRGDMLTYTGIDRLLRVQYINPGSDFTCNITGDGTNASLTLTSGDTSFLTSGQKILLLNAGPYTGVQTLSAVSSLTLLTFSSIETDSVTSATLAGETAELDEDLDWKDTPGDQTAFQVARRWIPVEAPDDSFDLTPNTHVQYFNSNPYSNQPFIRSTMIVDNLYMTNDQDAVQKFDGSNIYRAGIPAWQPGLFLNQDTEATAKIVISNRSVAYTNADAAKGQVEIAAAVIDTIPTGSQIRLTGSTETYTLRAYNTDTVGSKYYILLDRALDASVSAAGTAAEIASFRYYFRLNAVDANDNIVASAVTSSQDFVVELTQNAAVQLKMVGFPVFDNYDYDRLELEIYRTQQNTPAPYYKITTLALDFDNTQGYLTYSDSFSDSDISQTSNLDPVNTALAGQELGVNWADPLRAKYLTSIGNRLVLGNMRDYPELELQITGNANLANADFAGNTVLFRKDSSDPLTTTDMTNRVKYEWINGFTGNVSNFTIGTNTFSFDTSINTGANPGDWIYLTYATVATAARRLEYSGWYQIASAAGATVTVNLVGAASATSYPSKYVVASSTVNIPVLLGTDGNLGQVNGDSFDLFDASRRMALAINASMRMVDTSLTTDFTPWLSARGGNDLTTAGKIVVRMPIVSTGTPSVTAVYTNYSVFVNSVRSTSGTAVSALNKVFPSRLLVSYPNYPEIFDSPTTILDTDSQSAIDVNPADGQQITGVIPFFGETAFSAAQQAQVLVVFKTNSIYLVDINEKLAGRNGVQRIETEGLGCTAPYSIAVTKKGVMFANESGIYCLRRDQSIQYLGKYMERNWTENVDLNALALAQGHHYGVGRVYKLSVPYTDTIDVSTGYVENSEVFVYNHTQEDEGAAWGAWSRYDNHPATGWANLGSNAFFGTTQGNVAILRNTGSLTDYRDLNESILFRVDTRPNDHGNSGIRKILDSVTVHYRSGAFNEGTSLLYSADLAKEYTATQEFDIPEPTDSNGLDDTVGNEIVTIRHDVGRRRGVYFSIRIENDLKDETLEVAGLDYRVGGLDNKGILPAAKTRP